MRVQVHTLLYTYIRVQVHTLLYAYMRVQMHTLLYTYIRVQVHTLLYTYTIALSHIHKHNTYYTYMKLLSIAQVCTVQSIHSCSPILQ